LPRGQEEGEREGEKAKGKGKKGGKLIFEQKKKGAVELSVSAEGYRLFGFF